MCPTNFLTNIIKIDKKNQKITKILRPISLQFIDVTNKFNVLKILSQKYEFIDNFIIINDQKNQKKNNIQVQLSIIPSAKPIQDSDINYIMIEKIYNAITEFHKLPQIKIKKWNYQNFYNFFKNKITTTNFNLSKYENYVFKLSEPTSWVLSHNDLIKDNILIDQQQKIYLIDYDFTMLNDPLFDIASFISESQINDQKLVNHLIAYANLNQIQKNRLNDLINYQNLLWCAWAIFMWEATTNQVYFEIAESKYRALKKSS